MKLLSLLPVTTVVSLALVAVSADQSFTSSVDGVKTAATFVTTSAGIQFCPTGDCSTGQSVTLLLSRLAELKSGTSVRDVTDINTADGNADWTAPAADKVGSVDVSKTSFVATFAPDSTKPDSKATATITAMVFLAAGSVTNGATTISVPAGAIKFSAEVDSWPFNDDSTTFALEMTASGKNAAGTSLAAPTIALKDGDDKTKVVTFGEGLFMDVPLTGVVDTTDPATVTADITDIADGSSKIVWTFDKFSTKVTYDPVLRFVQPSTSTDTDAFEPPKDDKGKQKIKTSAKFGKSGARMDICPSGDCVNGQVITLSMSRLEEFDAKPKSVVKASNFNKGSNGWTPLETQMINGAAASVTTFAGDIDVGKSTAKFNLTAVIFQDAGWAMNGAQNLTIPAGALKFAITIQNWPFAAGVTGHTIKFGVNLNAKSKDSSKTLDPPTKTAGKTDKMDVVEMGEGMYMNSPANAVVDGTDTTITSAVETVGSSIEYVWEFPQFASKLYYDPVVGSTDSSAVIATDAPTSDSPAPDTSSPSPNTTAPATTPAPSSAMRALSVVSTVAAGALAVAYAFF
ncbi:hypothetical protein Poli38472_005757 [Pythium oligandrum]|uniref:Uncharacterized protein n=1 Tax=Pythium oligandrum TaxID=41045 RepID=A0A8K1CRK0_PYTOL|nr:hypothetical protein Poli38472_005757 [Pythium oligandrum]|eukprot:TMW68289.1 hypothetical protein Poli38472_005757 [Pythium oligandrum]